jgi:hypothetical protein
VKVFIDGTLTVNDASRLDAIAGVEYAVKWGESGAGGKVVQLPEPPPAPQAGQLSATVSDSFEIPVRFTRDIYLRIYLSTNNNANNQSTLGDAEVVADFQHTMKVAGLIPYDANGNVLPSNSLVFTTDSGYSIPVLGSEVPEPTSLSTWLLITLLGSAPAARRTRRLPCATR